MTTRTMWLLLSLLLVPVPAAAGELPDYVANAPGASAYPDDDGLILRQMIRVTLRADGRVEHHEETSVKMLTAYLTRNDWFDPRVAWDDGRATMRVDQARTYMADGTVMDAKANSLVPNTGDDFQWAVPYAAMRQMTVAHVGVEHGATSVTAYTVTDREPRGEPLWGLIELQSMVPILDQWITVEVPTGTPLQIAGVGCELSAGKAAKDGLDSYTIHRTDVPALNRSEAGWAAGKLERLAFSTSASWDEVRATLSERVEAAMRLDGAVAAKAAEIVDGSTLPDEQIARLHGFVVDGVRTTRWPVADFGYAARPADAVLDSSVGHPLDKAVLLAAMLRTQGLDAAVALAADGRAINGDVASPDQLDQIWVRVRVGSKQRWVDPTSRHVDMWDLAGHHALVLDHGESGLLERPTPDASTNHAALSVEVAVEAGDDALALSGTADVDLAFRYNPFVGYGRDGDRHGGLARGIAGVFGGAGVDDVYVGRQGCALSSLRATFSGGAIEIPEHGLVQVTLPSVPGALDAAELGLERAERGTALSIPRAPLSERVDVELTLPAGFELAYHPGDDAVANGLGSARRTVSVDGAVVTIRTVLVLDADEVPPVDYPALRALFDVLEGDTDRALLLRRVEE